MGKRAVLLLLLCVFGISVHAQFEVFRGDEGLAMLQLLSDLEKLAVAAKTGETHILELTGAVQGAVVQEDVTLNIDCLPWLEQNPDGYMIRWSFIQLDEFGNVQDPDQGPQELPPNEGVAGERVIVGGELNRWLNITRTEIVQGAEDPDSRIYICEVCDNNSTNCSAANYTQVTVGTPPNITDASVDFCWKRDNTSPIVLNCTVPARGQPRSIPVRMWLRNDDLVYSSPVGEDLDPDPGFFMDNPILMVGIFDPNVLTALSNGMLFYADDIMNITMPDQLPSGISTIEEARPELFDHSLGNWTCVVNSSLGIDSVTYIIRECVPQFTISPPNITVIEGVNSSVEVCVSRVDEILLDRSVTVTVQTGPKSGADAQATADLDYGSIEVDLTFVPADVETTRFCINIPIVNDTVFEVEEEFSVNLINARPEGEIIDNTTCIKIIDNDSKMLT